MGQTVTLSLYERLVNIRDWYFDQITNHELYTLYTMDMKQDKEYSFEELYELFEIYVLLLNKAT